MTTPNTTFSGMSPDAYDTGLGPMFFRPYAVDLAKRVKVGPKAVVLEIAAGTGIVTKELLKVLPPDGQLITTDIHQGMLGLARRNVPADGRVEWRTADACVLPFDDGTFDSIVCQFGLMFFSDKPASLREARRVLKPSGTLLFNTWSSLADNPIARVAHETIGSFFPQDPPRFYTVPFGLYDRALIEQMVKDAGFASVKSDVIEVTGESESADLAAQGLVFGTPVLTAIEERRGDPSRIKQAVAARLGEEGGKGPMRLPMRALVFEARR